MNMMTNKAELTPKPSRLWVWFVVAFVIQIVAWTGWFVIAANHRVQEVPLASVR
jgi:hypothetical protein